MAADTLTGLIGVGAAAGAVAILVLGATLVGWVALHCGFPRDLINKDTPPIQVPMAAGFIVVIITMLVGIPCFVVGATVRWVWRAWKASA